MSCRNWSPRRGRVPGAAPGDAKRDLTPGIRNELVRRSRYLHKNSGFVRELVGNMAVYLEHSRVPLDGRSNSGAMPVRMADFLLADLMPTAITLAMQWPPQSRQ